jgi:ribosome-binding factor A
MEKWFSPRTVHKLCNLEKNAKYFAIKIINKIQLKKKPFLKKYIDQEIEIMSKLNHPKHCQIRRMILKYL